MATQRWLPGFSKLMLFTINTFELSNINYQFCVGSNAVESCRNFSAFIFYSEEKVSSTQLNLIHRNTFRGVYFEKTKFEDDNQYIFLYALVLNLLHVMKNARVNRLIWHC